MKLSGFVLVGCFVAACGGEVAPEAEVAPAQTTTPTDPAKTDDAKPQDPRAPVAVLSKGCASAAVKTGSFEKTASVQGRPRAYTVSTPESDSRDARSLVVVLHDAGSDAAGVRSAFALESNMQRSIFVYPHSAGTWDASGKEDLAFIDAIVAAVGEEQCFVQNRIFVSGVGAGASFANHVGCQRAESVRAIASIAGRGPAVVPCRGSVAVWESNDDGDTEVKSDEARASFEHWLKQNRCTGAKAAGACLEGDGCYAGFPVTYCETQGMGHTVPAFAPLQVATFFARFSGEAILE